MSLYVIVKNKSDYFEIYYYTFFYLFRVKTFIILSKAFEETYDEQMSGYFSSHEFQMQDEGLEKAFNDLRAKAPASLQEEMNNLRDIFSSHEASVAVRSYQRGIYVGLCDRREFEAH